MDWKGKTVAFLGDSITEGAAASEPQNVYHQVAARKLGFTALNCGVGGTRIARQLHPSADPSYDRDFNLRADELPLNAAFLVVLGGTNDFGHGDAPFGAPEDHTVYTFYGACNSLWEKLAARFGAGNILVVLPLHRTDEESPLGEGNKTCPGRTLSAYAVAIGQTARAHGLRVLDLRGESALDVRGEGAPLFADNVHPNDAGHRLLGEMIAEAMRRF